MDRIEGHVVPSPIPVVCFFLFQLSVGIITINFVNVVVDVVSEIAEVVVRNLRAEVTVASVRTGDVIDTTFLF